MSICVNWHQFVSIGVPDSLRIASNDPNPATKMSAGRRASNSFDTFEIYIFAYFRIFWRILVYLVEPPVLTSFKEHCDTSHCITPKHTQFLQFWSWLNRGLFSSGFSLTTRIVFQKHDSNGQHWQYRQYDFNRSLWVTETTERCCKCVLPQAPHWWQHRGPPSEMPTPSTLVAPPTKERQGVKQWSSMHSGYFRYFNSSIDTVDTGWYFTDFTILYMPDIYPHTRTYQYPPISEYREYE